jgi:hypothetical protein
MKLNYKNLIIYTLVYLLATSAFILITNNYYLRENTSYLTNMAYMADKDVNFNNDINNTTGIKVETFGLNEANAKDLKILNKGAATARVLDKDTISVAIPRYKNKQVVGYLRVTDDRNRPIFVIGLFLVFSSALYIAWIVQYVLRFRKQKEAMDNTVAKIKAIYRNPIDQNYLITDNNDKVTNELNKLGEKIQKQALSSKPKKENLYEFIEFFDFPIFIYNQKGSIRRANKAFDSKFSSDRNIDLFSSESEFLKFLVSNLLDPEVVIRDFYFEKQNADYLVHLRPLADLSNNILVTLQEVTAYKKRKKLVLYKKA